MKIGIISTYPPYICGIGIYTKNFVDAFRKLGHDVGVITFKNCNYTDNKIKPIIKKHDLLSYIRAAFYIKRKKFDTILIEYEYAFYNVFFFPILLLLLRLLGNKVNIVPHTIPTYNDFFKKNIYKLINTSFLLFANHVFLHTKNAEKKIYENSFIRKPVTVFPIPIEERNAQFKINIRKKIKLVCFGFITHDKAIDVACEAVKGLKNMKLDIIGSVHPLSMKKQHDYFKKIKDYARNCDNIRVIDKFISSKEKAKIFKKADFILLPYRFAEQSATLTDAWSFGKIPICSDIEAFKEEIDGRYGLLFKNKDPDDLRIKILEIARDKRRQKKILMNIRNLRKKRSFDRIAERFIQVLGGHRHLY